MIEYDELFQFEKHWDSEEKDFGRQFFAPCLNYTNFYRGETGFFSDSALFGFSEISIELYERDDYKVELLTSPNIKEFVRRTLEENLAESERRRSFIDDGNKGLLAAIGFNKDPESREFRQMLFAHLIASEKFIIQFGIMNTTDLDDNLLHYKRGYFEFSQDDCIAHTGSGNFTRAGLGTQGNDLQVYHSRNISHQEDIDYVKAKVDSHWNNESPKVDVIPVNKRTLDLIKQSRDDNKKVFKEKLAEELKKYKKSQVSIEKLPDIKVPEFVNYKDGKWSYQGDAVQSWISNDYRGILAMATGTGKTITSMIVLATIIKEQFPLLVVISANKRALVNQWKKECQNFGIEPLLYEGKNRDSKLWSLGMKLESRAKNLGVIIMTDRILVNDETHVALEKISVKKLHIGDEVHNLGAKSFIKKPTNFFDFRLGLSATPDRQYDEEGTDEIFDYFGNKKDSDKNTPIFEFGLKDALDAGVLVPYDYFIHEVYLTEPELDHFNELTERISKKFLVSSDPDSDESLQRLYEERRKILENAEEKILFMKKELAKHKDTISNTLIFASAKGDFKLIDYREDEKQLNEVNKVLHKNDILFHQVTGDETGNAQLMQNIIKDFSDGSTKVLTSMVVLDEGVDIPSIEQAYILSSSTVKREWVQRRGRVLRASEGKKKAVIHDFLVLPHHEIDYIDQSDKPARKILKAELSRIEEFAELSNNKNAQPFDVITRLEKILYID